MKEITIKEITRNYKDFLNKKVEIEGWIRTMRSSKEFGFIEINDGSFFKGLQVVFDKELSNFDEVEKFKTGASLRVKGTLVESPAPKQPFELKASEIELIGDADEDYPLQKKRHTFEYLRTIAHLRPRSNTFSAVFRIRSAISYAIHQFFNERGFVYLHSPIITASDCEGAGEMFNVTGLDMHNLSKGEDGLVDFKQDFFGKEAKLTVSGQLQGEAFAHAFSKIYTFGPTFRAEDSNTRRHLAEFWMLEPEIAFADLSDNMDLAEEMTKYVVKYILENYPEEMEFFNQFIDKTLLERLQTLVKSDFGRVTYTEAIEILEKAEKKFEFPVRWGIDLQTEHEKYLAEEVYKGPVFITDYPKDIKAFYMRMNDDGKTVAAMDLLVPGIGELVGGSQREERMDMLKKRMKEMNIPEKELWWYLDLRRFGGTPHAGFGLGFERMVLYMTGMENIRDVIPFPRTPKCVEF